MNEALAQTLAAFQLAVRLSLPVLVAAFVVGLVLALISAWARLGDAALSALPRALVTLLLLGSIGSWMASELTVYASALYRALPELVP
jgi:flagellar biosynthetic protein FliQ